MSASHFTAVELSSGTVVMVRPRIRKYALGKGLIEERAVGDGYLTLMQADSIEDGVYTPAKVMSIYVNNAAEAERIAAIFLDFARALNLESSEASA